VTADIREIFDQAECTGQLCVQSLDGGHEVAVDADGPAVTAWVFKVSVAFEAETQFADAAAVAVGMLRSETRAG
jgi:hypothetical protein